MSMDKERFLKYVKICERAETEFPWLKENGGRMNHLMDIQSADHWFNLRLDEWLAADDENFYHDFFGIINESNRETYPATFDLFVPRYSGEEE